MPRRAGGTNNISIHALREEGDAGCIPRRASREPFLSTPSVRRATPCHPVGLFLYRISIHALREEGDAIMETMQQHYEISIHALREEGDPPFRPLP